MDKIKPEHLSEYLGKDVREITSNPAVFEALSEQIVNRNPTATMENLAEEFNDSDEDNPMRFAESKFEQLVHEDTYEVISYAHRNQWIEYTAQGLVEVGGADPEYLNDN